MALHESRLTTTTGHSGCKALRVSDGSKATNGNNGVNGKDGAHGLTITEDGSMAGWLTKDDHGVGASSSTCKLPRVTRVTMALEDFFATLHGPRMAQRQATAKMAALPISFGSLGEDHEALALRMTTAVAVITSWYLAEGCQG